MAHEEEACLLQAGVRAGLIDPEKGTAALAVFVHLKQMGGNLSFREFLIDRGLITKYGLERLDQSLQAGALEEIETISELGVYELDEVIGEGRFGTVFKAIHTTSGEAVAIKILSPDLVENAEALERFKAEAQACAQLHHPNIVRFIEMACTSGLHYMVMELMDGGSSRELLELHGQRLDVETVLNIGRQVACGLAAMHAIGLVHRDVKPENILLTKAGHAKLSDLGIALPNTENETRAREGHFFWGTPGYIAPEVIEGRPVGPHSDLFSLGATLYHLLAGRPPFQGKSPQATLYLQVTGRPQDIRSLRNDIPGPAGVLVMRLLANDSNERFPDAESIVEAIDLIRSLIGREIQTVRTESVAHSSLAQPGGDQPFSESGLQSEATRAVRQDRRNPRSSSPSRRSSQRQRNGNNRSRRRRD